MQDGSLDYGFSTRHFWNRRGSRKAQRGRMTWSGADDGLVLSHSVNERCMSVGVRNRGSEEEEPCRRLCDGKRQGGRDAADGHWDVLPGAHRVSVGRRRGVS